MLYCGSLYTPLGLKDWEDKLICKWEKTFAMALIIIFHLEAKN